MRTISNLTNKCNLGAMKSKRALALLQENKFIQEE